jgi:hypothetical protein
LGHGRSVRSAGRFLAVGRAATGLVGGRHRDHLRDHRLDVHGGRCGELDVLASAGNPTAGRAGHGGEPDYWMIGLPVIASQLRAVCGSYSDEVIEYLEPGNAASLAAAIRRLRDGPAQRAELAGNDALANLRNGRATQRQAYLGLFDALLDRGRGSADAAPRTPEAVPDQARAVVRASARTVAAMSGRRNRQLSDLRCMR